MISWNAVFFICWYMLFGHAVVSGSDCSAQPDKAVVIAGDIVKISCVAKGKIESWRLESKAGITTKIIVYQGAVYEEKDLVTPEKTEDGYFVYSVSRNNKTLQINETKLLQAGSYVCNCIGPPSSATTTVAVLAPKPEFSCDSDVTERNQVNCSCSIVFSGSADASFDLTIKDSSGSVVSNGTNFPLSINQNNYRITHRVIADPQKEQTFTCEVKLTNNSSKEIVYDKSAKTSVEWNPVLNATILSVNPKDCPERKCYLGATLQCETIGNPRPTVYEWRKFSMNKSYPQLVGNGSEYLGLNETGRFTYQCQTHNVIRNVRYNVSSDNFTVEVTEEIPAIQPLQINTASLTSIVLSIFLFTVVLTSIVVYKIVDKKKKKRHFNALEKNSVDNVKTKDNHESKTFVSDNDLYSECSSKPRLDPSDGGVFETEPQERKLK